VRRLTAWIGGAVGGLAAYRLFRRRPQLAAGPSPQPAPVEPDDRAEELRARLAESRAAGSAVAEPVVEEPPAEEAAAGPAPEAEPEPESPEDRRRRVHEEGRAALDEMKPEQGG
jgi:hypothetical protein